jgi:antitoxin component of MazEF toxin-antitoxin module
MAKYSRHDASVLHPATSKSNSLRTTVPAYIVNQFGLKKGDKLNWAIENGSVVIQVAKQENRVIRS